MTTLAKLLIFLSYLAQSVWFFWSAWNFVHDGWSFILWLFVIEPLGAMVLAFVSTLITVPIVEAMKDA